MADWRSEEFYKERRDELETVSYTHLDVYKRQVMIYSAGNGLVNLFTPTSGAIMGGLALAKIEYSTWLKFGAKLFVVLGIVCMVILTAAMLILPGAA